MYKCVRKNKKILSDINTHDIAKFLNKGVITPDHVIRIKPFPLVININNCIFIKMGNSNSIEKVRANAS